MELLPQFVQDFAQVPSAQAEKLGELLVDAGLVIHAVACEGACGDLVTNLVEEFLLQGLEFALVFDLLLLSQLLGREDLLLVLSHFQLKVPEFLRLLLVLHLEGVILALGQLEVVLDHLEVRFRLAQGLVLLIHL